MYPPPQNSQPPYPGDQFLPQADQSPQPPPRRPRRRVKGCCLIFCLIFVLPIVLIAALTLWVYLTAPGRTNILLLGIDSREPGSNLGRSDTLILTTFIPSEPYIGMLSIPRDLWVEIPSYGPNRINAAYFFAEADQPGSGAPLTLETVRSNFGVDVDYYVAIQHSGFVELVNSLGGIDLELPRPMSGYAAGVHHLDGDQALALVRDRADADDFARMERGQLFLKGLSKELLSPASWIRLPGTIRLLSQVVQTDIPAWQWLQLGFALLRVGPAEIEGQVIGREMVFPFTTAGGAAVLAPNWEAINPVLMEMFGQ